VGDCEAISRETLETLAPLRGAIASSGCRVAEVSILEDRPSRRRLATFTLEAPLEAGAARRLAAGASGLLEGIRIRSREGKSITSRGLRSLAIPVGRRELAVSSDSFFQANRHLLEALAGDVRESAALSPGDALDAFGGVGFFAGPLLEAGHTVATVEESSASAALARRNRASWGAARSWTVVESSVEEFLSRDARQFDLVVADPPRSGLPSGLARALARRTTRRLVYVSCEPATLARDLGEILPEGFSIARARLLDLFTLTHRVEAVVTLDRTPPR